VVVNGCTTVSKDFCPFLLMLKFTNGLGATGTIYATNYSKDRHKIIYIKKYITCLSRETFQVIGGLTQVLWAYTRIRTLFQWPTSRFKPTGSVIAISKSVVSSLWNSKYSRYVHHCVIIYLINDLLWFYYIVTNWTQLYSQDFNFLKMY